MRGREGREREGGGRERQHKRRKERWGEEGRRGERTSEGRREGERERVKNKTIRTKTTHRPSGTLVCMMGYLQYLRVCVGMSGDGRVNIPRASSDDW